MLVIISQATAQPKFLDYFCISNTTGNYTANSTYQTNLHTLLSTLSSNTEIKYGFYNFSYGQNTDKVNAIGLCRGDVKPDACRICLNDSRVHLTQLCPNQQEAIGWYDNCMLRYAHRPIFGIMEITPTFFVWNLNKTTEVDQFDQALSKLLDSLRSRAASGDSQSKYAEGNEIGPNLQYIYGIVQCTPDLSRQDCNNCLVGAISDRHLCCKDKIGGRVIKPSCHFRYEVTPFYAPMTDATLAPPATPLPSPPPRLSTNTTFSKEKNMSRTMIAIVVPVVIVAGATATLVFICICLRVRMPRKKFEIEENHDEIETVESLQFHFDTIRDATNNFSDSNKLGQGGFGVVYQGRLSNGQEIAVKRLSMDSSQGDMEFKNEVLLMAKLQHRNLVRLLGFCLKGKERLLVYEFIPNKSLDYFIFDPNMQAQLDWERRYKIIEGIGRGLLYLHEDSLLRIIHRDLKASNILLDKEMNPKISDFGMARLFVADQTQGNTNRIVGTYGYMAPEYAFHGHFSVKSDVFSFGVLLLEIVSGHTNGYIHNSEDVEHLISFAWRNWREETISNFIDPTLNNSSRNEIMRCIHIGLLCVQENATNRPTMASVVVMLNSYSVTLLRPSQPAYFLHARLSESRNNYIEASVNKASITELAPR